MKHLWSIICEKSLVDAESNSISLLSVIEKLDININSDLKSKLGSGSALNIPVNYEIVSLWIKRDEQTESPRKQIIITLKDPNGKQLNKIEKEIHIPKDKVRLRDINRIQGLPVTISGPYTFTIASLEAGKEQPITQIPVEVEITHNS